eukprot:CAMPEP_0171085778 /NCGR_PEP_ID=MMETSP0766_2-20121228/19135_1 /TAXON_ID=439317 /ORGANISM="Gambierdiscus australes, Strain CAWD 149" /LENGTH=399 /DNA_ID=CAMNT_0011543369 /DNA_START=8 /DNA_END=1207 /DNA_ORIENTATION=+
MCKMASREGVRAFLAFVLACVACERTCREFRVVAHCSVFQSPLALAAGRLGRRQLLGTALGHSVRSETTAAWAAPSTAVGYTSSSLSVGGQSVPVALWYPTEANERGAEAPEEGPYAYFVSVGKLFRTFLRVPLPLSFGQHFALGDGGRVSVDAPVSWRWAAGRVRPGVIFAHGYLGSRFDMLELCECLASRGFAVAAPDFAESITGSFQPSPATGRRSIVEAAQNKLSNDFSATHFGIVGHSAGGGTASAATGQFACGRVAIAGLQGGYSAEDPLLVIASQGDGVVPINRVLLALPEGTKVRAEVPGAEDSERSLAWIIVGPLAMDATAPPCHISFLSPEVNDAMLQSLSPLLPLARFLGLRLLDFDTYGELRDARAMTDALLPVVESFLAIHTERLT